MMTRPNEQNACDGFITILRTLTGDEYLNSGSPDEVNRSTPDIDFVLVSSSNGNMKIAVEHTRVESFEGQIGYVNKSFDIVDSINAGCREQIPTDRWYSLAIPPITVSLLRKRKRSTDLFINNFSSWVAETAPKLLLVDSYRQTDFEGQRITLKCMGNHAMMNGNVGRMPQEPENQKALQGERLRRAIEEKLPKLTKYKERGFKTALLLEDVAGTLKGSTLHRYENGLEDVDYVVVFVSNEERMIIGNVWKEGPVWYSSVPFSRRFSFYERCPG